MAGYSLSAEVIGAKEMAEAFAREPALFLSEMEKALVGTAIIIEGKAKTYAPINFGQLRESITNSGAKKSPNNVEVTVGTNLKYAPTMEYGRQPGKAVPITPLKIWAKHKLGNEKLAYAIAKSIQRKGIAGKFFFKKAREETIPKFENMVRGALDVIVRQLAIA